MYRLQSLNELGVIMKRVIAVAVMALVISGCVSISTPVKNKETQETRKCETWGFGWLGVPVALISYQECITEMEKAGFYKLDKEAK